MAREKSGLKPATSGYGLKEVVGYGHLGYLALMASMNIVEKRQGTGRSNPPHKVLGKCRFNHLYGEVFPSHKLCLLRPTFWV